MIRAYAAAEAGGPLEAFEYDPGELGANHVEIDVISCGICHSDLSMLNNDWQQTLYPFVPGHEVVGSISQVGGNVKHLSVGQKVGLGWYSESCMTCPQCVAGDPNLCRSNPEQTIVGRHGGFAEKVRCHAAWAVPLPEGLDPEEVIGTMRTIEIVGSGPLILHGAMVETASIPG